MQPMASRKSAVPTSCVRKPAVVSQFQTESLPASAVDNRLFVLILQHPHEKREPLATAPAIAAGLRRARLVTGLSWPNLERALGRPADPRRWAVLYLGSARPKAFAGQGEIFLLGRD